jgi:hypothetical protein
MNERIKELAEQAELELTSETKKFAELIVGECVSIADEYDGVGSTIVSRIREYFGVEE